MSSTKGLRGDDALRGADAEGILGMSTVFTATKSFDRLFRCRNNNNESVRLVLSCDNYMGLSRWNRT
jgi:hypothetical protein